MQTEKISYKRRPIRNSGKAPGQGGMIHVPVGRGVNTRNAAVDIEPGRRGLFGSETALIDTGLCCGAVRRSGLSPTLHFQSANDGTADKTNP